MSLESNRAGIAERIIAGDTNAQKDFLEKYKEQICRSIRIRLIRSRIVQNWGYQAGDPKSFDSRVESLFNESFARLLVRLHKNNLNLDDEKLCGYLYRISQNIILDRAKRKNLCFEHPDELLNLMASNACCDLSADINEIASKIRDEIEKMPAETRQIFERQMETGNAEKPGDDFKVTGAMRTKWYRARKALKNKFIMLMQ
jgi:DNA-directed RNA polymerase specialized sigma24 family protein